MGMVGRHLGGRRVGARALLALLDEILIISVLVVGVLALGVMGLLPLALAIAVAGAALGLLALLVYRAARSPLLEYSYVPIGEKAVVVDPLRPVGTVTVRGEYWRAECVGCAAERGETVVVVGFDNNTLYVKKV